MFDSTVTSRANAAPIEAAFNAVVTVFDQALTGPATINIQASWGEVPGSMIPAGVIGASQDGLYSGMTFAQVRRCLTSSAAKNPLDTGFATTVKTLPTTAPTGLNDSSPSFRSVFDLCRNSAPGKLSFGYASAAYLSLNGGATNLGAFNAVGAGDRSDWKAGLTDAQLAYLPTGVTAPVRAVDWKVLDALGWNQS